MNAPVQPFHGSSNAAAKERFLTRLPVFSGLKAEDATAVAARLHCRSFADGETIFARGDAGSSLVVIASGRVALRQVSAQGREFMLEILHPGEVLGELSLLDGKPRSVDAVALGPCGLLVLERRHFLPLLAGSPDMCLAMLQLMSARLRQTTRKVETLALYPVEARLARLLLSLSAREGEGGPFRVPSSLTQRDLGMLAGASREKVNQQLRLWLGAGILKRAGGHLEIMDPQALALIAELDAEKKHR